MHVVYVSVILTVLMIVIRISEIQSNNTLVDLLVPYPYNLTEPYIAVSPVCQSFCPCLVNFCQSCSVAFWSLTQWNLKLFTLCICIFWRLCSVRFWIIVIIPSKAVTQFFPMSQAEKINNSHIQTCNRNFFCLYLYNQHKMY